MGETDTLEVRLLGGLQVVRPDGARVGADELRTAKSADLLRLLALSAGKPVPTSSILARFWPEVEESRAKASLRTALSHIRAAVGAPFIARSRGGVALEKAWVDVAAYRILASDARTCVRTGRHDGLVRLAREAEALYTADFVASDDDAAWARGARASLVELRKTLLSDAAESAVELRWFRDAVDFAETAIAIDPGLERAHRALMRAYAGLGETERALRAYDRCRRTLASSLGADPSPMTSSVYLQILSGPVPSAPDGRLVGREEEVQALLFELRGSTGVRGATVVLVTGEPGSGRDAVLHRGVRDVGTSVRSQIVVCPSEEQTLFTAGNVHATLLEAPGDSPGRTVVVVSTARPAAVPALRATLHANGVRVREVPVGPLSHARLAELAESVLAGPVSPMLVHHLEDDCGGRAGAAVQLLHSWSATGSIVWTPNGLEVVVADSGWEEEHTFARVLREIQRQMSAREVELMQAIALLDRPVTARELAGYRARRDVTDTPASVEEIERLLDRLTDAGALHLGHTGFEFRHPRLRDATTAWMRPSARRRLRRRLVECGALREGVLEPV
jgi:DNA-binding SARP family transcriptional activator